MQRWPALHARPLHRKANAFLMAVNCNLMGQRCTTAGTALGGTGILCIVIEGVSGLSFPKVNEETISADLNNHGKTAGVEIDLAYESALPNDHLALAGGAYYSGC
jgi:hypothetical protein